MIAESSGPFVAAYRLQLTPDLGFRQAADLVPYLKELGVSHLYLSPVLHSAAGSEHGYDVVDHGMLDPELGGETGFSVLRRALERQDLGLLIDIVPNHMCIATPANRLWWDVLKHGPDSRYAHYFDIDWNPPDPALRNKVLLPILGDELDACLARDELRVVREENEAMVAYHEHRMPLTPSSLGTGGANVDALNADAGRLRSVLERQRYRPAHWKKANTSINYRRFFAINGLAGLRVEDPEVFAHAHRRIVQWIREGRVQGLRVDHPDGLKEPAAYFQRLRQAAPDAWIVAEKILAPDEPLRADWPVQGSSGYDFLNVLSGLFVDPAGDDALTRFYGELTGEPTDFAVVERAGKRMIVDHSFGAELRKLTLLLGAAANGGRTAAGERDREAVIRETAAAFPVYRTYVEPGQREPDADDRSYTAEALSGASETAVPATEAAWALLEDVLLRRLVNPAADEFVARFQQFTSAVTAKGVEDTAFYRYHRLISLNEVGGAPGRFGVPVSAFHAFCRAALARPRSLLATATHDTKRGEDIRMRINLLAALPEAWIDRVRHWRVLNADLRGEYGPEPNTEYFLYQTLVGAWPISRERLTAYAIKAVREAKVRTSWFEPSANYEQAVEAFVAGLLDSAAFVQDLDAFVERLRPAARTASLAQTLIKLTAPGFPNLYRGTELWDLNLVDPDNRRDVDFARRAALLSELRAGGLERVRRAEDDGVFKLFLIQRVLAERGCGAFACGDAYRPVAMDGKQADRYVAFARGKRVVVAAPRLPVTTEDAAETTIQLEAGSWRNVFTDAVFQSGRARFEELQGAFPVVMLVREGGWA